MAAALSAALLSLLLLSTLVVPSKHTTSHILKAFRPRRILKKANVRFPGVMLMGHPVHFFPGGGGGGSRLRRRSFARPRPGVRSRRAAREQQHLLLFLHRRTRHRVFRPKQFNFGKAWFFCSAYS